MRLALLEITFFFMFFLSMKFHDLWHSMMSTCLIAEVKQQWVILVLGWRTVSVLGQIWDVSYLGICFCHQTFINSCALPVPLMVLQLTHVDQKTFQLCLSHYLNPRPQLTLRKIIWICDPDPEEDH